MEFPVESITREQILEQVRHIVLSALKQTAADVYLFGSWAKRKEKRSSDIGVAVLFHSSQNEALLSDIRMELEESIIPYRVDVVNMAKLEPFLIQKIKKEGIPWKD